MRLISRGLFFTVLCAGAASATAAERPSFVLPDVICAAPGLECNVYFGSVFDTDSPRAYSFCAECSVGREQLKAFGVKIPEGQAWRRGLLKSPLVRLVGGEKTGGDRPLE